MKTKLILFYGPGSGSGKSTLSRLIYDVLRAKGRKRPNMLPKAMSFT